MPRSTVSRRVAELERQLGARLLHRTTRKLQLTAIGAAYYERSSRSLADLAEAEALVRATQATPRGRLRLTAPSDLGGLLVPMVVSFTEQYPEVRVDLELSQRMVDLVAEGFDLALRASASLPDSSLVARRITSVQWHLFASPGYLEARGEPRSPRELSEHECILFGPQRGRGSWQLFTGSESVDVMVAGRISANGADLALQAAQAGAGIAFLPEFRARPLLGDGTLRRVLSAYHGPASALHVVYPSARHLSATVRACRDHLIMGFRALS